MSAAGLAALEAAVHDCRRCPRLVAWREQVAREKRAAFRDEEYWGRPIGGFGDPEARVLLLGLAPAAHGANRTGRVFTGDRSGDFLFAALHRTGFANQPVATHRGDGLALRDCWITAAVRCAPPANKPTARPSATRAPPGCGRSSPSWRAARRRLPRRRSRGTPGSGSSRRSCARAPASATARRRALGDLTLLGCFHPSQQNTFTGKLTPAMLDAVLERARALAGQARSAPSASAA